MVPEQISVYQHYWHRRYTQQQDSSGRANTVSHKTNEQAGKREQQAADRARLA